MRGDRKKQEEREKKKRTGGSEAAEEAQTIDIRSCRPERIPQLMWRACIKKVGEVDPLTCLRRTGEMRIISFIFMKKVIKKIQAHLGVYEEKKNQRAPPAVSPEHTEPEIVPCDDG